MSAPDVEATLKRRCTTSKQPCTKLIQYCINDVSTLSSVFQPYQPCFNVGHWRCINFVQRLNSDVGCYFISNVRSTLFQRWSDVEVSAGPTAVPKNRYLDQTKNNSKILIWSLTFNFRYSSINSQSQQKLAKKITHFTIQFRLKTLPILRIMAF